jgi:hypothetical protein
MIHINGHDITGVYSGSRDIVKVYSGLKLVWSKITEILSCYSNGYWIDQYPWVDDAFWKDNSN